MKSQLLALCLSVPLGALAWVIPHDLEDGVYHIEMDDDAGGSAPAIINRWTEEEEEVEEDISAKIQKRGGYAVVPGGPPIRYGGQVPKPRVPLPIESFDCQFNVPPLQQTPYDYARESFKSYCDVHGVAQRTKHIAISQRGDVAVYMCNLLDTVNWCERSEFEWVEHNTLNRYCAALTPAWGSSRTTGKVYGRAWKGQNICADEGLDKTSWVGIPDYSLTDELPPEKVEKKIEDWIEALAPGSNPWFQPDENYGKARRPLPQPDKGPSMIGTGEAVVVDDPEPPVASRPVIGTSGDNKTKAASGKGGVDEQTHENGKKVGNGGSVKADAGDDKAAGGHAGKKNKDKGKEPKDKTGKESKHAEEENIHGIDLYGGATDTLPPSQEVNVEEEEGGQEVNKEKTPTAFGW